MKGFRLSPIVVLSLAEDMFDMTPVSLNALFSIAYRVLCCSTAHGKRQPAHHRLHCILEVFETSWVVSVHMGIQVTRKSPVGSSLGSTPATGASRLGRGSDALVDLHNIVVAYVDSGWGPMPKAVLPVCAETAQEVSKTSTMQ